VCFWFFSYHPLRATNQDYSFSNMAHSTAGEGSSGVGRTRSEILVEKIWIKPSKEINLSVVRALFDALKIRPSRCFDSFPDARRRASRHFHMGLTHPPPGVGIRLYIIMIICDNNCWLYLHDLLNYIQCCKRFCKLKQ